jgi:hypothetical protein
MHEIKKCLQFYIFYKINLQLLYSNYISIILNKIFEIKLQKILIQYINNKKNNKTKF